MAEISDRVHLNITKYPLEPDVGRLRKSLKDAIESKSSDSQKTEKFSSEEETDSGSAESDHFDGADLIKEQDSDEGMIHVRDFLMVADLFRIKGSDFFTDRCTSSASHCKTASVHNRS